MADISQWMSSANRTSSKKRGMWIMSIHYKKLTEKELNRIIKTNKRIDEISMLKGVGILSVMICHMATVAGLSMPGVISNSLMIPMMILFYMLSGYTSSEKTNARNQITKRTGRILIPYYQYAIPMLIVLAVIYLVIEKKTLAWYADGSLGLLFQLQSFHAFDPLTQGVHPMFYSVLIGWFLFQMAVSNLIFIPLQYALKGKKSLWKLVAAVILLLMGAGLYMLNLQGLNGEFFPPVCKIFILPNIPGIAGLMMIGNYVASLSLFDFDTYSVKRKALSLISLPILIAFILTDDHIYDFPIGKWASYGGLSYIAAPIAGLALIIILGILCNQIKRLSVIKKIFIHLGDNSMDYLMVHLFVGFLTAYIGGFWVNYLTDPKPDYDTTSKVLHFVILIISILGVSYTVVRLKQLLAKKE